MNRISSEGFTRSTGSVFLCLLLLLSACGNKGDLYQPVDDATLKQLEQAEQDLEAANKKKKKKQ